VVVVAVTTAVSVMGSAAAAYNFINT